jgi:hypothetical protein
MRREQRWQEREAQTGEEWRVRATLGRDRASTTRPVEGQSTERSSERTAPERTSTAQASPCNHLRTCSFMSASVAQIGRFFSHLPSVMYQQTLHRIVQQGFGFVRLDDV